MFIRFTYIQISISFTYGATPMRVNLNQLRAFFLAAREKSITKAAKALYITQPAVSIQIKSLEEALQLKLFRKCGKDLEITDAGKVLYGYAEKIFLTVGEMEHVLKGYADLTQGSLTMGTTRSFARHLMPALLSQFQEEFPGVKVYLEVGSSQEIADRLLEFKYDLGIIGRLQYSNKLRSVPYGKEEFCLVTPPHHRFAGRQEVSLQELKEEPIIIRENGSGSRHAILSLLRDHGVKPSVLLEAGSFEFIKEYISKGRGISFLYKPEFQLEAKMGLLKSVPIREGPIFIQSDIVFPRDVELSPPAKAFLRLTQVEV
jgi:DNA-binding transcriptional LysR family regulator